MNNAEQPARILARDIAIVAANAVAALCDIEGRRFWRSTVHRSSAIDEGTTSDARFPTVSLCCSQALLTIKLAHPQWIAENVATVIDDVARQVPINLQFEDLSSSDLTTGAETSPFTIAQHVQALTLLVKMEPHPDTLANLLDRILTDPSQPFVPKESGPPAHPFVMYHTVRAMEQTSMVFESRDSRLTENLGKLYGRLETETIRLLADFHVGQANPAQIVALAFCGSGLAQNPEGDYDEYAIAALRAACAGQEKSGCWALGRVVREDKDSSRDGLEIEISTYEIAGTIADAILSLQPRCPGTRLTEPLIGMVDQLVLATRYADKSRITLHDTVAYPRVGWCSDHPYNRPMIESWTSATVLRAALSVEGLLSAVDSDRAISSYLVSSPRDTSWPSWLRWKAFNTKDEIDDEGVIISYLDRNLVQPIRQSPFQLPASGAGTVSALLFGPPGTSKTTIVRGVADGLGWPVVELSPGTFIERGLELIEERAREVFDDLHRLERVIVLFDECDELFRARGPSEASEQMRSITAFVTASMLPKLQRLHDDGRVVFFICTNNFPHLDPAIKRRGRIDHIVAVGPPDEHARKRLVQTELGAAIGASSMNRLWTGTERFTRSELMHLLRLFRDRLEQLADRSSDALDELAGLLIRQFEPSLSIGRDRYQEFVLQRQSASHPHIYQGGMQ